MKILIVDDYKSTTGMFSSYLKAKGHDCTVSNNSKAGLNLILQQNYDMVLLDLAMPELSGFEIIDKLEKNRKINRIKIVVFTATAITEDQITKILEKGVYAFVKKPVKLAELKKILAKIEEENHKTMRCES